MIRGERATRADRPRLRGPASLFPRLGGTETHLIGPNFQKGQTRIGRERLPDGFVALVRDQATLRLAIAELHDHVSAGNPSPYPKGFGIIFRIASSGECEGVRQQVHRVFGPSAFLEHVEIFGVTPGQWHLLDNEHIAHSCNRHSDAQIEAKCGHVPIGVADFQRIPDVVNPLNIVEFRKKGDSPRIAYARQYDDGRLIVVEEIQRKRGLVFKTMYKQK